MAEAYQWQSVCQRAHDEPDPTRLHDRITEAETALFERGVELASADGAAAPERDAMAEAAKALLRIKTDRLGWPRIPELDGHAPPC